MTGGAGFVGATVALALAARHDDWEIVALDNLRRRGSEINVARLRAADIRFEHADVRSRTDLAVLEQVDAIVECSAEPSVQSGLVGSPEYVIETNLVGAYNCFELARRDGAFVVFLSTSRVYPVAGLRALPLQETETRFELGEADTAAGVSAEGISEAFSLDGPRTFYGTTKLAAEQLLAEYIESTPVRGVVNRCGVLAGPWQMGKVDQGVFTHWVASHRYGRPLQYFGYGGSGKQVRDVLHVDDLVDLVEEQLLAPERWNGFVGNVGGGRRFSLSLRETTELCREITGNDVDIGSVPTESPGDVPLFVSDCSRLFAHTSWRPRRDPATVLADIDHWIRTNDGLVRRVFA